MTGVFILYRTTQVTIYTYIRTYLPAVQTGMPTLHVQHTKRALCDSGAKANDSYKQRHCYFKIHNLLCS